MEDFEKKVKITEATDVENGADSSKTLHLLRRFLQIQQRRAQAYANLRRGFADYMVSGVESAYQQLCSEITVEFNECSKQVLEMESLFLNPEYGRDDLAHLLRSVQNQEKQKLHLDQSPHLHVKELSIHDGAHVKEGEKITALHAKFISKTATIQLLKKAGRPSERLISHEKCKFKNPEGHECVHVHEITEAAGTEEAEADAEYDNALNEAIRGVQDAVTTINDHLEEIKYEIAALEVE